jgi:4-amino-4-deoxy-L-arabinose transferase-like glycosyltransferase
VCPASARSGSVLPWARAHWKDLLCIAALVLLSVTARMESLDRVNLNPDEAQYEATASYMVGMGLSPFGLSNTSGGTAIVWISMARLFGPYSMFEVRVLVLLVSLAMALLLYFMVRMETTEWCGLASGLVFVHFNLFFEGLTVNREWFAIFALLLGILFFWRWDRRGGPGGWWLIFCAGALTALALWFKMQSGLLMFPVPILLAWRALAGDEPRRSLVGLVGFGAGGLAATAVYLGGFLLAGTLGGYLGEIFADLNVYAMGNVTALAPEGGEGAHLYLENLYARRPFRPLLLAAWAMSAIGLALMGLRATRRRGSGLPLFEKRLGLLLVLYFLGSLVTISLGERFFEHYYLFFVFPVAGLVGLAIHAFRASSASSRSLRWIAAVWLVLWVVDRAFALRHYPPARLGDLWPASLVIVLYTATGAGILLFGLLRPRLRFPLAATALICLEVGLVVVQGQVQETPRSLPHHRQGFPELVSYLDHAGRPGDRLFVWGWAPEIYSLARMEAASQYVICSFMVNDIVPVQTEPRLNEELAAKLMRELRERKPRFIVDASRRSWTMLASRDPWIYDLELYPDFELRRMLREEYRPVGMFDGCRVYERL